MNREVLLTEEENAFYGYVKGEDIGDRCTKTTFVNLVAPALRSLLTKVFTLIDASIPNKEQNRSVKSLIREEFNKVGPLCIFPFPDCNEITDLGYVIDAESEDRNIQSRDAMTKQVGEHYAALDSRTEEMQAVRQAELREP